MTNFTSGIYCIYNLVNNKYYIGKSCEIEKRWKSHKSSLKSNKHINIKLQKDWNIYNENNFEFKILKKCSSAMLDRYENFYMRKYDSLNNGYNISTTFDYSKLSIKREEQLINKLINILSKIPDHEYYLSAFSKKLNIPDHQTNILFKDLQYENIEIRYNLKIFINSTMNFNCTNKIIEKITYSNWQDEMSEAFKDSYI